MKKLIFLLLILFYSVGFSQHPNLILTKTDANKIKQSLGKYPILDRSVQLSKKIVDEALQNPVDVPWPKDPGGGYTHEKHKQNYNEMYQAGLLFQITGDEKYAVFIRDMLRKYAEMYPKLGKHPKAKKQTPGRLFWQSLNETVWLVHTIQAYDCIYDWLDEKDRHLFENNIFIPMANFFLNECRHEFDLLHNHGTWMVAAVGMTGYVLHRNDFIKKALYGSNLDKKSGFLAQLDYLFSPDGYYTEGGYYVRYALWPFFLFAEAIKNNQPELNIYQYRNSILKKALYSALQVTYTNGAFIPVNDALKEKTWMSPELIVAVDFVYANYEHDPQLLYLAKLHNEVNLSGAGLMVAKALTGKTDIPEFKWRSVEFTDGPDGKWGGVGILRFGNKNDQETLFMKYGSHGLSHGHFDKLTFLFYDQAREIIQDYGSARFLNVPQKWGGRYLPENYSWAKQTLAHNTVVVDMKSQYLAKKKLSQQHHSDRYFFNSKNQNLQYMSAKENNAYPGVHMQRTMALINDKKLYRPLVLDVFKIQSDEVHTYDLPYYYMGHLIDMNFKYEAYTTERHIMGEQYGYQHLWNQAEAVVDSQLIITWLNGKRFYSLISNTSKGSEVYLTEIGGTDPNFNLRNDHGIMIRVKNKNYVFASIIEPHGIFDPIKEFTVDPYSTIKKISVIYDSDEYTAINVKGKKNIDWVVIIVNQNANPNAMHNLNIKGKIYNWKGPFYLVKKER